MRSTAWSIAPATGGFMPEARSWWPLRLEGAEEQAIAELRTQLATAPAVTLEEELNDAVAHDLWICMANALPTILERDTLPDVAHVLNGWGDLCNRGHRISGRIAPFVHPDPDQGFAILQKNPEGEFHPWQTFAYAVMAGADVDAPLRRGVPSIRELAQTSRRLNTDDGCELGHLLFALAFLDPSLEGPPFSLTSGTYDAQALMRAAIVAHYAGHFRVCRKIHLTEGICALAARAPGMASYREYGQQFLHGQMEMLLVLAAIVEAAHSTTTAPDGRQASLLASLRSKLRLGRYLENHCYYAGHLIELACFAQALGYLVRPEHCSAAALVVNRLNDALVQSLPEMSFLDCFLHLGHYRRAITLLPGLQESAHHSRLYSPAELSVFACDIREGVPVPRVAPPRGHRSPPAYDLLEARASRLRPRFRAVVDHYARSAPSDLEPRGGFPHFRRIGPPWWPRALHYELLDYADAVGVEVHLESKSVDYMADIVRRVAAPIHPGRALEWEPHWYRGHGRLRLVLNDRHPAADVANAARRLIDQTFPIFDRAVAESAERDFRRA
jgi:hypothetical protein